MRVFPPSSSTPASPIASASAPLNGRSVVLPGPGIVVPDAFQEQLQDAGADAAALGFARARELIAGSRERAAGVCVIAPFRRPIRVLELLE